MLVIRPNSELPATLFGWPRFAWLDRSKICTELSGEVEGRSRRIDRYGESRAGRAGRGRVAHAVREPQDAGCGAGRSKGVAFMNA